MSAKRYFQLAFIWPVLVPSMILASPGVFLPKWIEQFCRLSLYSAGIPYLLFAVMMVSWSRNEGAATVRRSTYLAPLLFLAPFGVYLIIADMVRESTYRPGPNDLVVSFFIYGLLILIPIVLAVGYSYVGLINLAFVLLRSCGAFQDHESPTAAMRAPHHSLDAGAPWLEATQAYGDRSVAQPGQFAGSPRLPGSPYGFDGWEDEKAKGSYRAGAEITLQQGPTSGLAAMAATQNANSPGTTNVPAQATPPPDLPSDQPSIEHGILRSPAGTSASPISTAWDGSRIRGKPPKKQRSAKPHAAWDPLTAASIALLAPLITLSGFAVCRHYRVLHRQPAANHQVGDGGGPVFRLVSRCLAALPVYLQLEARRRPVHYLIPENYAGWVEIDYWSANAPSLPIEEGCYVVKFPPGGRAQTSSSMEEGWARDRYYYYSDSSLYELLAIDWGRGGQIWSGIVSSNHDDKGQCVSAREAFFVGTEEQYKRYGFADGDRKIGPIE